MDKLELATFGGGCFWCTEAIFQQINGVKHITSGYTGGQTLNPTYKDICTGTTGHAEVIQISFEPDKIIYRELLTIFFLSHDPTTLNQQGADEGTQYRSCIFPHDEEQEIIAKEVITSCQQYYDGSIVTSIEPLQTFYPAEKYHQNYYNQNGYAAYCRIVISPKLQKLRAQFSEYMI